MRLLYVDNFRGFTNTFIPIEDVNFLVGENSTGKTSILSLINLISSPYFWINMEFNQEDVQLGNFKDIVSIESENSEYFKFGLLQYDDSNNGEDIENSSIFLFTFVQHEGVPSIYQYSYIYKDYAITIQIAKDGVSYIAKNININKQTKDGILELYKKWIDNNFFKKDFKKLKKIVFKPRISYSPGFFQGVIAEELKLLDNYHGIKIPDFGFNLAWIAPIRSKPRRTYDQYKFNFSPEGEHTPYLIRKLLNDKIINKESFLNYLSEFGNNSGLLKSISINQFGETPESPFQLDVFLHEKPINIENVGYGVSQSLPIIVEMFARSKKSWFLIQQPEVHLHPRAQAALGDIFYQFASNGNKNFIIETHSDYTIDRFRLNIRKNKNKKKNISQVFQVLFFERNEKGNKVTPLILDNNGDYPEDQPKSFRDFFIREQLNLLGLE